MSAIEWLPFISPFIWVMLILNTLASIPTFKGKKPTWLKTTLCLFLFAFIGLALAIKATHIMHDPQSRIDLVQTSQLFLTLDLIALGIVLLYCLYRGKNLLSFLLRITGIASTKLFTLLTPLALVLLHILTGAFDRYANDTNAKKEREEQELRDKIHVNWKGEYSGENDWNKY